MKTEEQVREKLKELQADLFDSKSAIGNEFLKNNIAFIMKLNEIKPVYCDTIPKDLEEGVLYISKQYNTAIHLCACGCKTQTVTPFNRPDGWVLTESNGLVTLTPSIGNFSGQNPYHAHYFI